MYLDCLSKQLIQMLSQMPHYLIYLNWTPCLLPTNRSNKIQQRTQSLVKCGDTLGQPPYFCQKEQLIVEGYTLLNGIRVIVPPDLQQTVLKELHRFHSGVVARSYFRWPSIDIDIESLAKNCTACQEDKTNPPAAPLHS